ncbi:MAG TPA: AAA family ATPase [Steroidobacteraceae bacterium]|nr:AAA family ATPase [Steroidobacteraceae bacterium]
MYLELFKLKELPFRLSPDPQFLYLSKQHARAKAYMESTIWFTDGFVVITGEIGSGKTTLIESFLKEVPADVVVAQINQTQVTTTDFLQTVLVQFGFSPFKMRKAELLSTLNNFLIEQHAAGRKVLLIVDEAQNLEPRVLEEIRLLSGVETTKEKVLRIILAGQPELNVTLNSPRLEQLTQRVRLRFHLATLSEAETRSYIEHRLEVAGAGDRDIFAPDTFHEIYRYTGGVPRLINTLCDTAMMAAYTENRDSVQMADIASAVTELRWPLYGARDPSAAPAAGAAAPGSAGAPHAREAVLQDAVAHESAAQQAGQQSAPHAAAANEGAVQHAPASEPVGKLLVATDGRTVQEVPLRIGRLIVGRTPDNDVHIDSRFVSRHHCQIITTAHSCVIEDLNSTNGIYVKSARVRRHYLNDGDVVLIGKHELIYVDERALRGRPTAHETEPKLPALGDIPELHAPPAEEPDEHSKDKRSKETRSAGR